MNYEVLIRWHSIRPAGIRKATNCPSSDGRQNVMRFFICRSRANIRPRGVLRSIAEVLRMSDRLMSAAVRFSATVDECRTVEAVLDKLHDAVSSRINAGGIWCFSLAARRGARTRFPIYLHRSVPPAWSDGFWRSYHEHGPSFLLRYAWRTHRDFTMTELVRKLKPPAEELWIIRHNRQHGMLDGLYIATFGWWIVIYWSPKPLRLDEETRRALRLAAEAAARRVESLIGHEDEDEEIALARREREIFRLAV